MSLLSKEAAAFHFLSGYTARGSTELGAEAGIHPTFSTCFGAPFMPRPAQDYADLLMKRIEDFDLRSTSSILVDRWVWRCKRQRQSLPNSCYPSGRSRSAEGALLNVETKHIDALNLDFPVSIPGVADEFIDPKASWGDDAAYDAQAEQLAGLFTANIQKFDISEDIVAAGPAS